MQITRAAVIIVYHGVLVDEVEIVRFVLSRIPDLRTVTAGPAPGRVTGIGGVVTADASLDEIRRPAVVAVPGGIGSHLHAEIASWLRHVSPRWLLASSTGSALLAASGRLQDATASGHWLAGHLLERYGAHPSHQPVVVDGPIITCSSGPSAFRAALVIAESYGGQELVTRIRADAATAPEEGHPAQNRSVWTRLRDAILRRDRRAEPAGAPIDQGVDEIEVLDLGLVKPRPPQS
ncbi:DJ-1/PfpI family protein [Phytoactinopolyspora endophytica]|uniref:DJ-1/PfpI family protein n=1 Tax=Phytoactinopolyspora endophytica TaxID=1642495 RepID=UPI00101B67B7|nr:DJ-1/PfpI family protein [Phytoactinopolyspora endophytica]